VSKPWRDPEHTFVFCRDSHSRPSAKMGRALAEIDCHVENLSHYNANEFSLGLCYLVMQSAQYVFLEKEQLSCTNL
jgi:hypothetical protein